MCLPISHLAGPVMFLQIFAKSKKSEFISSSIVLEPRLQGKKHSCDILIHLIVCIDPKKA